ncbi:DUF3810 domain-containing protein [Flavobacterium sp.]|uniref:DUF3810 domain-containing protein n=1 Tax=Flavobacterium sp. TaxID=239 RepID=UPI003D11ABCB
MQITNRKYFLVYFFIFQILLLKVIARFPVQVEKYYSNGIYPYIARFSRSVFGLFSFSVGDILYSGLIIWLLVWYYKNRKASWNTKILAFVNLLSISYFLFHFLWGLNYYRVPLYDKMHLKTDYSQEELVQFTKKLIVKTNATHFLITHDTAKSVKFPYPLTSIYKDSDKGYNALVLKHPYFNYETPSIKNSLISYPLTYMGFGGYINPFTNEAQVNYLPPKYNLPATTAHEMAHQMGFASESECNFIGYLAVTSHPDNYYKYAGYTYALRYCLKSISLQNEELAHSLLQTIHPGVLKNFKENRDFALKHTSVIDKFFEWFYDHFLKLNQQDDGIESYSKFLDLLVNYEFKNKT